MAEIMEMYQLQYFVQVARHESFSRAAQSLGVSQPALSKAIRKLERELGSELFDRSGRQLRLNDKGKRLLESAEITLRELRQVADEIRGSTAGSTGSLRVGVFGQQTEAIECLSEFMVGHPLVDVAIDARRGSSTDSLLDDYDLVFFPDSPTFSNIQGTPYASSRLCLGVGETHPLAGAKLVDLRCFAEEPFIFMNTAAGSYEYTHRLCLDCGFEPRVRAVTSSGLMQSCLIRKGLGVGFVTQDAQAFGNDGIVRLDLVQATSEQVLCFAARPQGKLSPLGAELLTFTRRYFGIAS